MRWEAHDDLSVVPQELEDAARSVRDGRDGPLLESLKGLDGAGLRLPARSEDHPDREFLDRRFRRFLETAD